MCVRRTLSLALALALTLALTLALALSLSLTLTLTRFSIRHVLPELSTGGQPDFLYSDSVHAVAQARGWWKAKP